MSVLDTVEQGRRTLTGRLPTWAAPAAVGAGAVIACGVVAAVDPNQPGHYPTCPFLLATGRFCPGCGTLRAVHALTRGDLLAAIDLNLVTVAMLPVLVWAWIAWLRHSVGRRAALPTLPARLSMGLAATITAFWLLRNLPVEPLTWLAP